MAGVEKTTRGSDILMNGPAIGSTTTRSDPVKYVVLIYSNPATWAALPEGEADRVIRDHFVVIDELEKSGELVSRFGLSDPGGTKTLRIHDGIPAVTDGPFGEAKEQLLGVFLVDVESQERVVQFAAPLAQHSIVEIRAVMDETTGEEM
jgi:hypothetical protein